MTAPTSSFLAHRRGLRTNKEVGHKGVLRPSVSIISQQPTTYLSISRAAVKRFFTTLSTSKEEAGHVITNRLPAEEWCQQVDISYERSSGRQVSRYSPSFLLRTSTLNISLTSSFFLYLSIVFSTQTPYVHKNNQDGHSMLAVGISSV